MKMQSTLNWREKLLRMDQVAGWRQALRRDGRQLVVTNGCFDLLHLGHVTYLDAARQQGDVLLVGVNGDDSVRQLKGAGRPVHPQEDRALLLAALQSVDGVCIFPQRDALELLQLAQPDVYVKGGDYTIDTINQSERRLVESLGGRVVVIGHVPGRSTSGILNRLAGKPPAAEAGAAG